jgi:hypothetical protein
MNTIEIELTETTATLPKELFLEILKENERLKEELERTFVWTPQEMREENDQLRERVLSIDNERAELQRWKDGASKILDDLNLQEIGKKLGLTVGTDIAPRILPGIQKLKDLVGVLQNENRALLNTIRQINHLSK